MISRIVRSSHAGVSRRREKIWLYRKRLLPCWHHQEFPISAQQKIPPLPFPWQVQYFLFLKKPNPSWMHSFLPSILNQLWQIGQHKAEPWLHYPPTLIWNECEIIFLFGPAVLQCRPVWCFIYPHLRAQNSVNPLFVFKHLRWLLCVSLSPCWLLWAVCLAGCQWSWSGRRPAVRDDAWFQRCVTLVDSGSVLSVCAAALNVCLLLCTSAFPCLSIRLPACRSPTYQGCLKPCHKIHYSLGRLYFIWFIHGWKYTKSI